MACGEKKKPCLKKLGIFTWFIQEFSPVCLIYGIVNDGFFLHLRDFYCVQETSILFFKIKLQVIF